MKEKYNTSVNLLCITCGGADFNFNEDKSYVQCKTCAREYTGGYDELVEMNQENINKKVQEMKQQITKDVQADLVKTLKRAFRK